MDAHSDGVVDVGQSGRFNNGKRSGEGCFISSVVLNDTEDGVDDSGGDNDDAVNVGDNTNVAGAFSADESNIAVDVDGIDEVLVAIFINGC